MSSATASGPNSSPSSIRTLAEGYSVHADRALMVVAVGNELEGALVGSGEREGGRRVCCMASSAIAYGVGMSSRGA